MAKIIDITEKLSFEKQKIKINDIVVEVIDDAETVLKMLNAISESEGTKAIKEAYNLLFSDEDKEKINALKLNVSSFTVLVRTAMNLASGNNAETGEELGE